MTRGRMHLGAFLFLPAHHVAGWRHPDAEANGAMSPAAYLRVARIAEDALFDMLFIGDTLAVANMPPEALARSSRADAMDPLLVLAMLCASTRNIGLVATVSTTYNAPYTVARQFATLDHLSGGRAGWNVVTSSNIAEAGNYGLAQHPEHADRYARAEEFLQVTHGLWDGWRTDAYRYDKASGIYFEPDGVKPLDHAGAHFSVRGPLNVGRSPQGRPVILQAGSSGPGQALAARTAEVIFTAQPDLASARLFYGSMREQVAQAGRSPDDVRILPGLMPIVGTSRSEADDIAAELDELVQPEVGLALLSEMSGGIDLAAYDLDEPFPEDLDSNAGKSRLALFKDLSRREGLSIRQLYKRIAAGRGHWSVKGTATDVADQMQEWFTTGAADGFNVLAPYFPGGLSRFASLVVPELQHRGLFRTAYDGSTFRETLGLTR